MLQRHSSTMWIDLDPDWSIYSRYSCAYQKHFPTVSASRRSLPNACWNHSCGKQAGLVVEPLQDVLLELEFLTQWSTHACAEISWKFRHRDALPNEYAPCCMSHHESCADFCACLHVAQGQFARLWSCRSTWRFDAWTSYCLCLSDRSALSGRPKACCTCFCCQGLVYDTIKSQWITAILYWYADLYRSIFISMLYYRYFRMYDWLWISDWKATLSLCRTTQSFSLILLKLGKQRPSNGNPVDIETLQSAPITHSS